MGSGQGACIAREGGHTGSRFPGPTPFASGHRMRGPPGGVGVVVVVWWWLLVGGGKCACVLVLTHTHYLSSTRSSCSAAAGVTSGDKRHTARARHPKAQGEPRVTLSITLPE